jgi:hypothetical protein
MKLFTERHINRNIFWLILGLLLIWVGCGTILNQTININATKSEQILPLGLLIFGSMLVGAAINKICIVAKAKNKGKK